MTTKQKLLIGLGGVLLLGALATAGWIWRFRTYTPAAVMVDIRAAIRARNAPQPAVRFLELPLNLLPCRAPAQNSFDLTWMGWRSG